MPEGPELFLASLFINTVSQNRLYGGRVVKSEVSTKNPEVEWEAQVYRIHAVARGKEIKVTLCEGEEEQKEEKTLDIIFRFGMSGSFKFTPVSEMPKHAHLRFFTINEDPPMVLSFVDYRRFGRWNVGGTWGVDRGPDPMWEYQSFRENILTNLNSAAFNKPICEAMLNQRYFNGIGNYLRAEILYRCGIRPFDEAREILSELKPLSKWYEAKHKQKPNEQCNERPDFLDLCHILPKEVINLSGGGKGYNVDPDADDDEYKEFRAWLQCYYQDGMKNLVDHNGRTMWFSGEPGRLTPKDVASRAKVERKKQKRKNEDEKQSAKVPKVKKRSKHIKQEGGEKAIVNNTRGRRKKQPEKAVKEEPDSISGSIPKAQNLKKNPAKHQSPSSSIVTNDIKKRGVKAINKTASRTSRTPCTPKTLATPTRRSSRLMISQ